MLSLNSSSILKGLTGVVVTVIIGVTSWLVMSQISSQVLQAQSAGTLKVLGQDVQQIERHDAKVDEALAGINLTTQRLTDMLARHDADLAELKDDVRDLRRRASRHP